MKKPPQIDLSKVKIGQRVKLRNGVEKQLTDIDREDTEGFAYNCCGHWYDKDGNSCLGQGNSQFDIIQILSLPKKKAVKKPDQLAKLRSIIADFKAGRDVFSKEIKRL